MQADPPPGTGGLTPDEPVRIHLGKPKHKAAGSQAVVQSFKHVFGQSGLLRGAKLMTRLNQKNGFDSPFLRLARSG